MNLKKSQRLTHLLIKSTDQSGRLGPDFYKKSGNRTSSNREDPELTRKEGPRHA